MDILAGDFVKVSVIIAAYNAATTIAETLESLCAQTVQGWEAIVVDDNSSDETTNVAARFADIDDRIRLVSRSRRGGESAARNTGISTARYDWLLFLDSDDWISPRYLERMTDALISNSGLDAVHCGWTRIAPNGALFDQTRAPAQSRELFATFARHCAFAIHACVVRRSMVETVGGFDATLRTCEDWDLWQRIARAGALFGAVSESLAFYRMRADSASMDGYRLLADGLRVITRGHSQDPRVPHPYPPCADGMPADQLPNARLLFACWAAGLVIGRGDDARPLLDAVKEDHDPAISADQVARQLFQAALLPTCRTPSDWFEVRPGLERNIDEFLQALEGQAKSTGLANRSRRALERLVLEQSIDRLPVTIGATHAVRVEITKPISHIFPPAPSERLVCLIEIEGERLGSIELPVCDGMVSSYVLADAIAAEFAWQILGRYFEQTVYKEMNIKPGKNGFAIWRGKLCLADDLDKSEESFWLKAHDKIGWTVFLQEVCLRPDWPDSYFYDPQAVRERSERRDAPDDLFILEISRPIPDIRVSGRVLNLVPVAGGAPLGVVTIPVKKGIVPAHRARAALIAETGFELALAAVREGLLGKPLLAPPLTLRERLASRQNNGNSTPQAFGDIRLAIRPAAELRSIVPNQESAIVFGRRTQEAIGTSASRRAMLPAAAAQELLDASKVTGEGPVHSPEPGARISHVIYAPDLILFPPRVSQPVLSADHKRGPASSKTFKTYRLPILMYHSVAPTGPAALSRYRVSPEAFEEQLGYLRDSGYYSVGPEDWRTAVKNKQPLPGRAVMLTFDDGYLDFIKYAWPLLRLYGFSAIVFLVAEEIGGTNRWDRHFGEEVPLLGWQQIRRLRDEGIEFGSHSASHRPLNALSPTDVVREGARSRAILEQGLGQPVRSFAYPHGAADRISQHLIGACGYVFGFSCRPGLSGIHDALLALPRIEITGSDTLQSFITKIGAGRVSASDRDSAAQG